MLFRSRRPQVPYQIYKSPSNNLYHDFISRISAFENYCEITDNANICSLTERNHNIPDNFVKYINTELNSLKEDCIKAIRIDTSTIDLCALRPNTNKNTKLRSEHACRSLPPKPIKQAKANFHMEHQELITKPTTNTFTASSLNKKQSVLGPNALKLLSNYKVTDNETSANSVITYLI